MLNADLPDGMSRSSAKKRSNYKQRTLSIAPSVERLSHLPSVHGGDVVSRRSDYLDQDNLKSLGGAAAANEAD